MKKLNIVILTALIMSLPNPIIRATKNNPPQINRYQKDIDRVQQLEAEIFEIRKELDMAIKGVINDKNILEIATYPNTLNVEFDYQKENGLFQNVYIIKGKLSKNDKQTLKDKQTLDWILKKNRVPDLRLELIRLVSTKTRLLSALRHHLSDEEYKKITN